MLNLQVGSLLIRNKKRAGYEELDQLIGLGLYISGVNDREVRTCVAYPEDQAGKVVLANDQQLLEEFFETKPMSLVEKPNDIKIDPDDWFLLCLLFCRYSPAIMEQAVKAVSQANMERRATVLMSTLFTPEE